MAFVPCEQLGHAVHCLPCRAATHSWPFFIRHGPDSRMPWLPIYPLSACSLKYAMVQVVDACVNVQERGRSGTVLPQPLLQELAALQLQSSPSELSALSQELLRALLPLALPQGLRKSQAVAILSACWHQVCARACPVKWLVCAFLPPVDCAGTC